MSEVEEELLLATGFVPKRRYDDRQDYLAALARATITIDDDTFETLSDAAADWCNAAMAAIRGKKNIPDFPDVEAEPEAPSDDLSETSTAEPEPEPAPVKQKRSKGVPPRKLAHPPITLPEDMEDTPLETDRYGCTVGSKNAAAAAMLEKGCRMSDIKASIGGTYYNLLERLEKAGHKIEKAANGMITLIHKEDA